jgi:hypothetical protein
MAPTYRERICELCGKPWLTAKTASRTCSPKCRAILREREKPSQGKPEREYPSEIIKLVQDLYTSGATVAEIRVVLGPGYKAQTLVERYVPQRRKAAKRHQSGDANDYWKGDQAGYAGFHRRVEKARGKPKECRRCGERDPDARYDWANLTGHYEDVDDYERMCVSCHRRYDIARRAQTGDRTIPPRLRGGDVDVPARG